MGICSGISNALLFIQCFQSELEFRNVVFWWREECQGTRRKNLRSMRRDKNQQQTQATHGVSSSTRATLVRGERSHQRASLLPKLKSERRTFLSNIFVLIYGDRPVSVYFCASADKIIHFHPLPSAATDDGA